jgi:hypothetical protein
VPTEIIVEMDELGKNFNNLMARARQDDCEMDVGYSESYALLVHEDLTMPHANGQAKYLEQPMRENEDAVRSLVRDMRGAGIPLKTALEVAGNFILSKSQPLVPVDTGRLRDSGFVEVTGG